MGMIPTRRATAIHLREGTWPVAAALGVVMLIGWGVWNRALADGPLVSITAPPAGFKLRPGRTTAIQVTVQARTFPVRSWNLGLRDRRGKVTELASGMSQVADHDVAQLIASDLQPCNHYTLVLSAEDTQGSAATDQVEILVPDLQYAIVPLDAGNFLGRNLEGGFVMDGSGTLAAIGGQHLGEIDLIDIAAGHTKRIGVELQNTVGYHLSGDGQRLVFAGFRPPFDDPALGFIDLNSGSITYALLVASNYFFTTDRHGRRVALQSVAAGGNSDTPYEFFFYDDSTKEIRQLTNDPNTILFNLDILDVSGLVPVISGDGSTIAFATTVTLGLPPPGPGTGVHIFAYDVASATLRRVHSLPNGVKFGLPAISDDGHWLTFVNSRPFPPDVLSRALPARLDLRTGAIDDAIGGITEYPGYDSVVSGDGRLIVISTEADPDPRVGNADHNMELFAYDSETGQFTQITETTGGIGSTPNGCAPYQPQVSTDASIVGFSFSIGSGFLCQLDGPQRNEADGFTFRRVRAVRKRPGNRPPVFARPADVRVEAGQTVALTFVASDPDGAPVVFFAQEAGQADTPRGADIVDSRQGTAAFEWPTKLEDVGGHRLRVGAFDEGGGETVDEFTIAVCSRIVADGNLDGVVTALFTAEPPAACRDADLNHDFVISAADVVQAAAGSALSSR